MRDVNPFDNTLSVTEALSLVKSALKNNVFVIQGEVTGIKSGNNYSAVYFSIKDATSAMPCLIWKNRYKELDFDLEEGMLVNLTGNFSIYTKKGQMNFDVLNVERAGEGQLRAKVNALIKKLADEGITDASNKKEIPAYPEKMGVITSGSGAVIHDILRTVRRRTKGIEVNFWGVAVEGGDASTQMLEAVRNLDAEGLDVILLVRGGGSFEDMMPFNDEALSRAIFEAKTPIVTAIGHDQDTTVADLVSDLRASTPTAAAEMVTQNLEELPKKLQDEAYILSDIMSARVDKLVHELKMQKTRLDSTSPDNVLMQQRMRLDFDLMRMQKLPATIVSEKKEKVGFSAKRLEALSPLSVLTRGYSYTKDASNNVIKSIRNCEIDDSVTVVLSDGKLQCEVKGKE